MSRQSFSIEWSVASDVGPPHATITCKTASARWKVHNPYDTKGSAGIDK